MNVKSKIIEISSLYTFSGKARYHKYKFSSRYVLLTFFTRKSSLIATPMTEHH